MAQPRTRMRWRQSRLLIAAAIAVAVVVLAPLSPSPAQAHPWTPMSAVSYTFPDNDKHAPTAKAHLIAFNDFHGNIDPPGGSGGLVNGNPAGGVEYLATYVKRQRAQDRRDTRDVFTVAAGDLVGASPLVSAAFHDEPAIEEMNALGLQITSVGNHEFDEGIDELRRLQLGGCHPVDGCQDGDGFAGAKFHYLAANVVFKKTGLPILLPFDVRFVDGVPVAFVGMTLQSTPTIVNPAGVQTVNFLNEVTTANQYADFLGRFLGIHSLVLLIHQGGNQQTSPPPAPPPGIDDCQNFAGDIAPIVAGLRPEYGVVISGHTHNFYSCALPNSSGAKSVVTSAGSFGRLLTDVSFTVNKRTKRFATVEAHNQIVLNGVRNADDTGWLTNPNGSFVRNPDLVDPDAKRIADKYRTAVAPLANRIVGRVTTTIDLTANDAGESPLGDVIADGMLRYTPSAGAQIALMNPGGIRAPLVPNADGTVTYGACFTVQPFNNLVVTLTYTGAQLKDVLEQQFVGVAGQISTKFLQISAGFSYSYDSTKPNGQRISDMMLNGKPIDPAATYRVSTNDFLANGGDGFTTLKVGTDRATAPGFDVDALVTYLGTGTIPPGPQDRIHKIA